jgi:hypothetical protein
LAAARASRWLSKLWTSQPGVRALALIHLLGCESPPVSESEQEIAEARK